MLFYVFCHSWLFCLFVLISVKNTVDKKLKNNKNVSKIITLPHPSSSNLNVYETEYKPGQMGSF